MRFDWKKFDYFLLFAAAATLLALLFPGDTVWLRDEAELMALALDANEAGRPALEGLADPSGIPRRPARGAQASGCAAFQ